MEEWRDVVGYEGLYMVSNYGNVMSMRLERILQLTPSESGYVRMSLYNSDTKQTKTVYIHRLVAKAFIPNPENKRAVNHINSIRHDNHVDNLEWVTASENTRHARAQGRWSRLGVKPKRVTDNSGKIYDSVKAYALAHDITSAYVRCMMSDKTPQRNIHGVRWYEGDE